MNGKICSKCEHDYFLASILKEQSRWIKETNEWEFFKIASLICSKCGRTKQVEVDVYREKSII